MTSVAVLLIFHLTGATLTAYVFDMSAGKALASWALLQCAFAANQVWVAAREGRHKHKPKDSS